MKKVYLAATVCATVLSSCIKDIESFPPEPQIYYENATPRTMDVLDPTAYTKIVFRFTDGDGDIGLDPQEQEMSIFLRDSRDTSVALDYTYQYPFPYIPPEVRGPNGIEGHITMMLGPEYYKSWDSLHLAIGKDTLVWSIYVQDAAGNRSNTIVTDTIYVSYE